MDGRKCYRCGRANVRGHQCAARNAECHKCKKVEHFAVVCRSRVVEEIMSHRAAESGEEAHFVGEITDVRDNYRAWTVTLQINGTKIDFKIDTGADTSVISENIFKTLKSPPKLMTNSVNLEIPWGKTELYGPLYY